MMNPKWFWLASVSAASVVAVGCAGDDTDASSSTAGSGASSAARGGATGVGGALASSGGSGGTGTGAGGSAVAAGPGTSSGGASSSGASASSGTAGASSAGTSSGGGMATAGSGTLGGAAGSGGVSSNAGAAGKAGAGASAGGGGVVFTPPFACMAIPVWPTPQGSKVTISGTRSISGTYDGKLAEHDGSGGGDFAKDCSTGAQSTNDPLFELEDGATIQNVILGNHIGDGIHCKGSCTIKNVWWPTVCDDAATMLGSGTMTVDGGGAKGALDKTFQHNGNGGTVIIKNFYVENAGKLYRSCGEGSGCDGSNRKAEISNIIAVGVDQIAGVNSDRGDKATLSKICVFRSPTVCKRYTGGDTVAGEGPNADNCVYKLDDVQVLLDATSGKGTFTTATQCVSTLKVGDPCTASSPSCLKGCGSGAYGTKQCTCSGSAYTSGACYPTTLEPAKTKLDPANAASASCTVSENQVCAKADLWKWCKSSAQYCVCVVKPGYLEDGQVYDCENQWW